MRTSTLTMLAFAALCCLLTAQPTQAQNAYGYASITHDGSTVTGYASTEIDYETAYYYDAEVQAQIQDENGNVLASGSASGNPSAFTFLDVFQAALCIRFSIIGYVITTPRFLGCNGGYYDYWGFSDYWWGEWWDYGDFFGSRRNRCIFSRLIFIATIIADVIRCLPADVSCDHSNPQHQILPSGLGNQTGFIDGLDPNTTGKDNLTVVCRAVNPVTGQPQSGVVIRFGFPNNAVIDDGGHQNHLAAVQRPLGKFTPTQGRTNSNGEVTSIYTAPEHSGKITIQASSPDTGGSVTDDITVKVPNLEELLGPTGNDGYILTDTNNPYHPGNHWGKPAAVRSLRQIGIDYRNRLFPESQYPNGVPADRLLRYNDMSLKFGGKFDIPLLPGDVPRWRTGGAHSEHKVGINCDISDRTVPNDMVMDGDRMRRRWEVVEEIFASNGSSRTNREHCRRHWHVRFEYGGGNNPTEGCERAANPNLSTPAGGVAATVPGRIEAERYDEDDNVAGAFVPDDGSYGSGDAVLYLYPLVNPIPGGGSNYVSTVGGQWMNYTINVASSGSYTFEARVASPYSYNTFHVEIDGVNVTGSMYIPNTGSGDAYQFVTFDNIWLEAGRHVASIVVEGAGQGKGNFDYFTLSPYTPPWVCDPPWWETQNCRQSGGYWDYDMCACNYGWYYY